MNGSISIKLKNLSTGLRDFLRGEDGAVSVYGLVRNAERIATLANHTTPYKGFYVQEAGTSAWTITLVDSGVSFSFTPLDHTFYPWHTKSINLTGVTGSPVFIGHL